MSPYKYKTYDTIKLNESPTASYFTYNNRSYGYSYLYFTSFYNSKIENGYFNNCVFSGGTISSGNFFNCKIYDATIESGSFYNCTINSNTLWYYGIWFGSGSTSFGPNIWYNGIWNEGVFSGKTWISGIFNTGVFQESIWVNGIFNGGNSIYKLNSDPSFVNSFWSG